MRIAELLTAYREREAWYEANEPTLPRKRRILHLTLQMDTELDWTLREVVHFDQLTCHVVKRLGVCHAEVEFNMLELKLWIEAHAL